MNTPLIDIFQLVVRLVLVFVFLPSAVGKLRDLRGFVHGVITYHVLPSQFAHFFGLALPFIELGLVFALGIGFALPFGGSLMALLLGSFIVAMIVNLRRGRSIPCSCSGTSSMRRISWGIVARNSILLLCTLPLVLIPTSNFTTLTADLRILSDAGALLIVVILFASVLICVGLAEWTIEVSQRVVMLAQR